MEPAAERRLRNRTIFAFGLLWLLSYTPMILVALAFSSPYSIGVNGDIAQRLSTLLATSLPLLFGAFLLLAIRFRRAFTALFILIIALQAAAMVSTLLLLLGISGPVLLGQFLTEMNFVTMFALQLIPSNGPLYFVQLLVRPLVNALLWLLPFIVYYRAYLKEKKKAEKSGLS